MGTSIDWRAWLHLRIWKEYEEDGVFRSGTLA